MPSSTPCEHVDVNIQQCNRRIYASKNTYIFGVEMTLLFCGRLAHIRWLASHMKSEDGESCRFGGTE